MKLFTNVVSDACVLLFSSLAGDITNFLNIKENLYKNGFCLMYLKKVVCDCFNFDTRVMFLLIVFLPIDMGGEMIP